MIFLKIIFNIVKRIITVVSFLKLRISIHFNKYAKESQIISYLITLMKQVQKKIIQLFMILNKNHNLLFIQLELLARTTSS